MSYLTLNHYLSVDTLMIALPQTELRRQKSIQVATLILHQGQTLELRSLYLHLIKILVPTVTPRLDNNLGLVSVGLYLNGGMLTGGLGLVTNSTPGVAALSPYQPVRVSSPGLYKVIASNNSNNVDVSVLVTGSAKIWA